MRFVHDSPGTRVVFGLGRADEATNEARRLGSRPILIAGASRSPQASSVRDRLQEAAIGTISAPRRHVPVEDATAARELAARVSADSIIALGGGSAIGLAKAIALSEPLPIVAIPTTYAGSEMTSVWGITDAGVKTTGRDNAVAPRTVIYDPELTVSMDRDITVASGLNALAHAIEALWAPARSPLAHVIAERAIEALVRGVPRAAAWDHDLEARADCLLGAWLAGAAFAVAGTSVHHKLCHVLGGRLDLPHAETHAVMLRHTVGFMAPRVRAAHSALSRVLGVTEPVDALRDLIGELGGPFSLCELGVTHEQAMAVADEVDLTALAAPFVVSRSDIRQLLAAATGQVSFA
jgi:maleylacetate reductase